MAFAWLVMLATALILLFGDGGAGSMPRAPPPSSPASSPGVGGGGNFGGERERPGGVDVLGGGDKGGCERGDGERPGGHQRRWRALDGGR